MEKHQKIAALLLVGFGGAVALPAHGSMLTYSVSGTFNDGGTFSGTFGYDPVANTYYDSQSGDQFLVTTTSVGPEQGNIYRPSQSPLYYSDESSTATELYIGGATPNSESSLILLWNLPLNGSGGGSAQPITGGSENYSIAMLGCGRYCVFYPDNRQVATGYVELQTAPVPLPPAVWLLLSALCGLGIAARRRLVA